MEVNIREALRYLGVRNEPDAALLAEACTLAQELQQRCTPRWIWRMTGISRTGGSLSLTDMNLPLPGRTADRMLRECSRCAVMVCTLGVDFDTWSRRLQSRDMHRAVLLDALGSAWVESGCDAAEDEIRTRFPGMYLTDRFSPGYGDLPLECQSALLEALDAPRRLGVYATPSHMMIPQKSVTAVIGLADRPQMARIRGCAYCAMNKTCTLRKAGTPCDI